MNTKVLRKQQAVLAAEISQNHKQFKEDQRNGKFPSNWPLRKSCQLFRHRHIGYSLARGRVYEAIERPGENNKPDFKEVERFKAEYEEAARKDREAHEEAIRLRSA